MSTAFAQTYKWVDEKGVTHYGPRPPPGKKAQEVGERLANPGNPKAAKSATWEEQEREFQGRRLKAEQAQEMEARKTSNDANAKRRCFEARDYLERLRVAGRTYRLDDKGQRVFEGEQEHAATVARAEKNVAERCK